MVVLLILFAMYSILEVIVALNINSGLLVFIHQKWMAVQFILWCRLIILFYYNSTCTVYTLCCVLVHVHVYFPGTVDSGC